MTDTYREWLLRGIQGAAGELAMGMVMLAVATPILGALYSPWWLLVTIPCALLAISHAIFRIFHEDEEAK